MGFSPLPPQVRPAPEHAVPSPHLSGVCRGRAGAVEGQDGRRAAPDAPDGRRPPGRSGLQGGEARSGPGASAPRPAAESSVCSRSSVAGRHPIVHGLGALGGDARAARRRCAHRGALLTSVCSAGRTCDVTAVRGTGARNRERTVSVGGCGGDSFAAGFAASSRTGSSVPLRRSTIYRALGRIAAPRSSTVNVSSNGPPRRSKSGIRR